MLSLLLDAAAADSQPYDFTGLFSGLGGGGVFGVIFLVGRMVLDKRMPSRSDDREDRKFIQETLSNVVTVLQREKASDLERLKEKQDRIDTLESESQADYDRIVELRKEIVELRDRLAQKDRNIQALIYELTRYGVAVSGLNPDDMAQELSFTHPPVPTTTGGNPTIPA